MQKPWNVALRTDVSKKMKTRLLTYLSLLIWCLQINAFTISFFITALTPSTVWAQETSDTELLDKLKDQYDLNNPKRNHQNGTLSERIVSQMDSPSNDISQKLQGMLNEAISANPTYDFSQYQNNQNAQSILSQQRGQALAIGRSHGSPDVDDNGNINLEYTASGTRQLNRSDDGTLVIAEVENAGDIQRVSGVSKYDLVSNEVDNNEHTFDTPDGYGDEESIRNNVRASHQNYRSGKTSSARAYQAITAEIERGVNTTLDPDSALFQPSKDVFNQVNSNEGDYFQACTTETENVNRELSFPVKTEYTCNTTNTENPFFCEVEREYRVPIIVGGEGFESCGLGCYELAFGDEEAGDNYLNGGSCTIFSENRLITMNLQDGIELQSVSVSGAIDDHVEFLVDGELAYSYINDMHSYTQIMPNASSFTTCEMDRNMVISGNRTFGFKRHFDAGESKTYDLQMNVAVGDKGEAALKIRFQFADTTGKGFGESFIQYPQGCLDRTGAIGTATGGCSTCPVGYTHTLGTEGIGCYDSHDNFVPAQTCAVGAADTPYAAESVSTGALCMFDGWSTLEVGDREFPSDILDTMQPMFDGDENNVTWRANLDGYRCDPLKGDDYCYIDPETLEEVCLSWEEMRDIPDQCQLYEEDASCSEVKRECLENGWYEADIGWNEDGEVIESAEYCFNETVTYECEVDNTLGYSTEVTTSSCDAALPCAGGECDLGEEERNDKFMEAALMANIVQNVDADRNCTVESDPSTCSIFDGEAEYCSWEVTGLGMDCCEAPGGINILAYISASQGLIKANRLVADGVFGETAQQGAQAVIDIADTATSYVTDAISSVYDSVMGTTAETATADLTGGAISAALDTVKQKLMETVYNALPEELASLIFDVAVDEATGEVSEYAINETLGSVLSFVGTAYTIYSLTKLALQMLTMCDENEMDMGTKLAQRQCFKVGGTYCSAQLLGVCYQKRQDYCCYNSILARIVMEQAGPLLDKDMTDCKGLTQDELARLDFNQIDLSEWVGLLLDSGEIKTEANEQILTGGGTLVQTECETWEEVDPVTGAVTTQESCFSQMEGGRLINSENRQTVSVRTLERTEGAADYAEQGVNAARQDANELDCSVSPRPPVCEFGIDPTDTDSGN